MSLIQDDAQEIRRRDFPTDREKQMQYMQQVFEMKKKFIQSMMNFVEKSVTEKKKVVRLPISKRDDIAKLRRLIKKIANNFGYNVKNVKKRYLIIEDTKFIVEKIKKIPYTMSSEDNKAGFKKLVKDLEEKKA